MLRKLASAFARSTEPSGKDGSSFAIRAASWHSSIRVRRISSVIVSTRMVSSIVPAAPIAAFWEAPATEGGGCIACDGNEEDERASACAHQAEERCFLAERRARLVRMAVEEKRVRAVAGVMSRAQASVAGERRSE
jgi:hypothetical protein